MISSTFIIVKPDATKAGHVGEITSRFEGKGFELMRIRKTHLQLYQAQALYREHWGKDFFEAHIQFMLSDKVVAVSFVRSQWSRGPTQDTVARLCGDTDPRKAAKGTIRGDFGTELPANAIHFSDSHDLAIMEASLIFLG